MRRLVLAAAATAALALGSALAPPGAGAATFCVHAPAGCSGTAAATIQAALDAAAAAPGRDRVEVGWQTGTEGFAIAAGNAVDVVGVGRPSLDLGGGAVVSVAEPSAVITGVDFFVTATTSVPPIDLVAGTLQDSSVWVTAMDPTIRLGDATLRRVEQPFGMDAGVGVQAVGPGGLIEDSQLLADRGLVSTSDALVVRRTLIDGSGLSAGSIGLQVRAGAATVDDTLVQVGQWEPGGVTVDVAPGAGSAALTLRGVTIAGDRDVPRNSTGLRAACTGGGTATVSLLDTVAWASGLDLEQSGSGCAVALDHVRYGARAGTFADGAAVVAGPVAPMGAFTAGFGSPLIDAGSTRAVTGGDVRGAPRVVDGDGDGVARRDIGAGEYQRQAPTITAIENRTPGVRAGAVAELSAIGADDPDGADGTPTAFAWTVDGVPVPAAEDGGPVLHHAFSREGAHAVSVVVRDPAGLTASASTTVPVGPALVLGPPATVAPVPGSVLPPGATTPAGPGIAATLLGTRPAKGRLRVGVSCLQRTACRARVVLGTRAGGKAVTLGRSALITVPASKGRVVSVPLSVAGRRLLARHPKGVAVTVAVLKGSGRSWTNGKGGRVRP